MRKLLIALIVVGVALRFMGLDRKLYWIDEVYSSITLSGKTYAEVFSEFEKLPDEPSLGALQAFLKFNPDRSISDVVRNLKTEDPHHSPLYYIGARAFGSAFGDTPAALRAFAALLSLLALAAFWWLFGELAIDRVTGLAIVALSPLHLVLAQNNREYSLWGALIVAATAALVRAVRPTDRTSRVQYSAWLLYAVLMSLAFYTHIFTFTLLAAHAVFILMERRRALPLLFAFAAAVAIVAYLPWLLSMKAHSALIKEWMAWLTVPAKFRFQLLSAASNTSRVFFDFHQAVSYLVPALIALAAIALVGAWARAGHPQRRLPLALIAVPPMIFLAADLAFKWHSFTVGRYLLPTWVGFQLAVAGMIANWRAVRSRLGNAVLAGLLALQLASCAKYLLARTWWHTAPPSLAAAAEHLRKEPGVIMARRPHETHGTLIELMSLSSILPAETRVVFFRKNEKRQRRAQPSVPTYFYGKPSRSWIPDKLEPIEGQTALWLVK